jgi:hypothetical protein
MSDILYTGSGATITLTTSSSVNAIVFIILNKGEITPIQKFSYPAKTGYTTLTKDSNTYTGTLTGSLTEAAKENMLIYSMKIWDSSDLPIVDEGDIILAKKAIASSEVKPT